MIISIVDSSQLQLEAGPLREAYDQKPMGFNHNLNHLPHFQRDESQRVAAADDSHQAGLDRSIFGARPEKKECVFDLVPGRGLHQPQNAPYWVQTKGSRSIPYSFVFETCDAGQRSRARVFNHTMRRAGLHPLAPGLSKLRDAAKGRAMQVMDRARSAL